MKVKPRADTAEVFTTWINEYVESQRTGNPPIPPKPVKLPIQQPRISIYTGVNTRGELAFDLWKYEVKCLLRDKSYSSDVIVSIIRKSLRGKKLAKSPCGQDLQLGLVTLQTNLRALIVPQNHGKAFQLNFIVLNSNQMKMLSNGDVDQRISLAKSIDKGFADQSKKNEMLRNMF